MPNEDALTTVLITLANACKVTAQEIPYWLLKSLPCNMLSNP